MKLDEMTTRPAQTLNRDWQTITWGMLFIWWGIAELFEFLPEGTGALGIGLILLGLNVARALKGIPTRRFSVTAGILMLVMGGLILVRSVLAPPFELPILPILLIVFGLLVLVYERMPDRDEFSKTT